MFYIQKQQQIQRKITSLTLMAIMVAGGMTFAVPGMTPEAYAANANLFVSAENSLFDNYMAGPQVIEVVIIDSSISDTDESKGEPDVTVNGNNLRMVQATDGNWYGYFADYAMAKLAASEPNGLNFGAGDAEASADSIGLDTIEADGLFYNDNNNVNVIREEKDVNQNRVGVGNGTNANPYGGQIGIDEGAWPFIQLYKLSQGGNVVVQYNKGGDTQSTILTFDTVDDYAGIELDRTSYPQGAQVHATVIDVWLNIDPTDEDSWTFNTVNGTAYYHVYNDDDGGRGDNDSLKPIILLDYTSNHTVNSVDVGNLMCSDCALKLNPNVQGDDKHVITIQDNADSIIVNKGDTADKADAWVRDGVAIITLGQGTQPVTITEQGPNSGIFGTYDEYDLSVLKIIDDADRDTLATIDYNDSLVSVLVTHAFATIDIQPASDVWYSGELIPVVLVDADNNKNSRADEDIRLSDPSYKIIPSLRTGDPITLGSGVDSNGQITVYYDGIEKKTDVNAFSDRAILNDTVPDGTVSSILIDLGITGDELKASLVDTTADKNYGYNLFNYDISSLPEGTVNISLVNTTNGVSIDVDLVCETSRSGLELLNGITCDPLTEPTSIVIPSLHSDSAYESQHFGTAFDTIVSDYSVTFPKVFSSQKLDLGTNPIQSVLDTGSIVDTFEQLRILNETSKIGTDVGDISLLSYSSTAQSFAKPGDGIFRLTIDTSRQVELNSPQTVSCIDCALNSFGEIFGQTVQVQSTQLSDAGTITDLLQVPNNDTKVGILIEYHKDNVRTYHATDAEADPIVLDFFAFGFGDDGRTANQIVRLELEESGDNTDTFEGGLEYTMLNQLNILDAYTYTGLDPISDEPTFIVMEDLTDEDSPRVNYLDLGADGVSIQIADQQEAPSHSGVVALDSDNYKVADTVIVTLTDADLNVDSDLIDIFTTVAHGHGGMSDTVGEDVEFNGESVNIGGSPLGRLLDITFDDQIWTVNECTPIDGFDDGLHDTGFTLIETETASGVFTGAFQIPTEYCRNDAKFVDGKYVRESVIGTDIEVNYVDFRDASGETIEVGDSAGVRHSTGSVSLDRTVYPVPFAENTFNLHASAGDDQYLPTGDVTIHIRVSDSDYNISASDEDKIASGTTGPVEVTVSRGQASKIVATAGAATANAIANEYGPITEIAPDEGIFEAAISISYKDGPTNGCPEYNPDDGPNIFADGCVLQGDIVTVEYTDPTDASGEPNTVTDSATFDLRNSVLQSDKPVYIIGSDMILTLIEPDFDLDNDAAESYSLDLIEWDSDAAMVSMGTLGGAKSNNGNDFDPEPSDFRETGDSTGVFQVVIEIPEELDGNKFKRGEEIELEYTDWGPSGSNYVGEAYDDINLTIFTSNFGSTVELDQNAYTWTDKVYITIVAPDHNFDSDLIDEIGNTDDDPIRIATKSAVLDNYKLEETGTDTGIFTGEVILTGFAHDANGDGETDDSNPRTGYGNGNIKGLGPTNGFLETKDNDDLSVSFEFSEDEMVVGSALIRWNIGEVQWLEASYASSGTGVVRVIDPDMNLNPESVDNFEIDVWLDTPTRGINLTVTETNQATGIFEGTVFFTVTDESSGHRLQVSEGDTVTAEYTDRTLPEPHNTLDKLDIFATTQIDSIMPPFERVPDINLRMGDAFSHMLDKILHR